MSRLLIIVGAVLIMVGILLPWLKKVGIGHLPGDVIIKREGFTLYFPIMTCIVISVIVSVSVVLWLVNRF